MRAVATVPDLFLIHGDITIGDDVSPVERFARQSSLRLPAKSEETIQDDV